MKKNKVGYVYMITSPSGRVYVVSTNNITRRFNRYNALDCKTQRKLYNSFIKYGVKNHIFETVWEGDWNERYKYEHLIGIYYECITKGLNCLLPGYNDVPSVISEETISKFKLSRLGKKPSLGLKHTKETKLKIGIASKNRIISESTKLKLKASSTGNKNWVGKSHSKETKLKMSLSSKGVLKTEQHKLNLSVSKKGKKLSEESLLKRRLKMLKKKLLKYKKNE